MKHLTFLVLVLVLFISFCGCGQQKSEKEDGKIVYDTIPATLVTITPEYFFSGDFIYTTDVAILKERVTGINLPIALMEVFPEAKKQYQALKPVEGETVRAELRGYLQSQGKEGKDSVRRLVITQVITMDKAKSPAKNNLLTGTYESPEQSLLISPDHTYKLNAKDGESESGDWFLSTEDIIVFASKAGYTLMNLGSDKKSLQTRDETPVVFKKKKE